MGKLRLQVANDADAAPVIERIPITHLRLDKENPRLAAIHGETTQKGLIKKLWDEMAVDELALSIAANGYFEEEPLIVIPEKAGNKNPKQDTFTVVEGNRRLAAVLILRDANLRLTLGATDLPTITPEAARRLDELPVSIYDTREELWEYFGFRHINGPQAWDAFSKAQFVAKV